jgi:hypothetical protein
LDRRSCQMRMPPLVKLTSPSASDAHLTLGWQHGHLDEIDSHDIEVSDVPHIFKPWLMCRGGVSHEIATRRSREA